MNFTNLCGIVVSLFGRFNRYICSFVASTPMRVGEYNLSGRFHRYLCSFVAPTPRVGDNINYYSMRVCGPLGKWKLDKKNRKLQWALMTQISAAGNDPEKAALKDHLNFHLQKLHHAEKKAEMKAAYEETKNCWCQLKHCPERPQEPPPGEPPPLSSYEKFLIYKKKDRRPMQGIFEDEFEDYLREKRQFKKREILHPADFGISSTRFKDKTSTEIMELLDRDLLDMRKADEDRANKQRERYGMKPETLSGSQEFEEEREASVGTYVSQKKAEVSLETNGLHEVFPHGDNFSYQQSPPA